MLSAGLPQGAVPKLERPGPLRDRVYEALLELITTRALQPGQHLVEQARRVTLGCRGPGRGRALQRLNTEGWVDRSRRRARPARARPRRRPTSS